MTSPGGQQPPFQGPIRPGRLVGQNVLAAAAVLVFGWLVHVLANHPDGGTGGLSEGTWVALLLILLVVVLLLMVFLSDAVQDRLHGVHHVHAREGDLVIGCPACGTVFSKDPASLDGRFRCDNCGREGTVTDHSLQRQQIRNETCTSCGHIYQEFKEHSECPACHTFNAY